MTSVRASSKNTHAVLTSDESSSITHSSAGPGPRCLHDDMVTSKYKTPTNILHKAVLSWLQRLFDVQHIQEKERITKLLKEFPSSYVIYLPMLLLPKRAFEGPMWGQLSEKVSPSRWEELYAALAHATSTSHVAVNASIPASVESSNCITLNHENIQRKPLNLRPLYGDFGCLNNSLDTSGQLDRALWVTVKQNDIWQCWAPLHTMFSRGNLSEKKRIMQLHSTAEARSVEARHGSEFSAVDLYAGIGYFAFSYAKVGASAILCWEINPWSIEGLRRGIRKNSWTERSVDEAGVTGTDVSVSHPYFLVFPESNRHALSRIDSLRDVIPPVRHVNCGLLPTAKDSWYTALAALDRDEGGWIHLHETIHKVKYDEHVQRVKTDVCKLASEVGVKEISSNRYPKTTLEHVETVKSYGPRLIHCVMDFRVEYT